MSRRADRPGVYALVGSGNPVKRRATATALPAATVERVSVASGVPDQPRGRPQTVRGAETRARNALAAADDGAADVDPGERVVGVGIEGGVADVDGVPGTFLIVWAAVADGDRVGRGAGPSFPLPAAVATRVADGEELGPVMDDVLGETGVAEGRGAAGALTAGATDREAAMAAAVRAALGPFRSSLYDEGAADRRA